MSKKLKGVAFESSPYAFSDDPKASFNHQSFLVDYENLYKETDAAKKKLRKLNQRKLTLLAEVQFLRHRYESLMKRETSNRHAVETQHKPKSIMKSKNHQAVEKTQFKSKGIMKPKNHQAFEETQHKPKGIMKLKNHQTVEESLQKPKGIMKPKNHCRKQGLNQMQGCGGEEAVAHNPKPPFFDLNQISREEDGVPLNCCEQFVDMNESGSGCRNALKGSSVERRKRKMISWQDQVRVL